MQVSAHRTASVRVVSWDEEGELERGALVESTAHTQQAVPNWEGERGSKRTSSGCNSLSGDMSEGSTYTPNTGCCSNLALEERGALNTCSALKTAHYSANTVYSRKKEL